MWQVVHGGKVVFETVSEEEAVNWYLANQKNYMVAQKPNHPGYAALGLQFVECPLGHPVPSIQTQHVSA